MVDIDKHTITHKKIQQTVIQTLCPQFLLHFEKQKYNSSHDEKTQDPKEGERRWRYSFEIKKQLLENITHM